MVGHPLPNGWIPTTHYPMVGTTQWLALPYGRTPTTRWTDLNTYYPLHNTQTVHWQRLNQKSLLVCILKYLLWSGPGDRMVKWWGLKSLPAISRTLDLDFHLSFGLYVISIVQLQKHKLNKYMVTLFRWRQYSEVNPSWYIAIHRQCIGDDISEVGVCTWTLARVMAFHLCIGSQAGKLVGWLVLPKKGRQSLPYMVMVRFGQNLRKWSEGIPFENDD